MTKAHNSAYDFYRALCVARGYAEDRKIYARWAKQIGILLGLLRKSGTEPIGFIRMRANDYASRKITGWWITMLKVDAERILQEQELVSHNAMKETEKVGKKPKNMPAQMVSLMDIFGGAGI